MANLRNLKKDIDYLVSEVVSDCYAFIYINKDKKHKEAIGIINKAIELRNNLFERVNKPEGDKKQLKTYYKNISKDLLTSVNGLFEELSSLTK